MSEIFDQPRQPWRHYHHENIHRTADDYANGIALEFFGAARRRRRAACFESLWTMVHCAQPLIDQSKRAARIVSMFAYDLNLIWLASRRLCSFGKSPVPAADIGPLSARGLSRCETQLEKCDTTPLIGPPRSCLPSRSASGFATEPQEPSHLVDGTLLHFATADTGLIARVHSGFGPPSVFALVCIVAASSIRLDFSPSNYRPAPRRGSVR
jgi:hypothetical protein